MRSSGEHTATIDAHDFCDMCAFEGWVDLHLNHATQTTWWACPSGHTNEGTTND